MAIITPALLTGLRTVQIHDFRPHQGQIEILRGRKKRTVCCMGRRFGKTLLMQEIITTYPGGAIAGFSGDGRIGLPCAWYAPNDLYFTRVYYSLAELYHPIIKRATRAPRPMIEFVNGGSIEFWTLKDPMKCGRGRNYARVVIDEAAHARHLKDAWEMTILWTLADLDGDAWFISTPNGLNYFYELFNRGKNGERDWVSFTAPSYANPYLPDGWIDEQREQMPELVFQQEIMAQFVVFGGGLVKPEHLRDSVPPVGLPVVIGVDLAISKRDTADYTAIVAMSRDPETGLIYILEAERHRAEFSDVIALIKAAAARHKPKIIAVESTQYQAAIVQELARTTSLPVRGITPDRDKLTRFLPLLTRYERGMVRHDPARTPAWFREQLLAFPNADHDDGVDAAVYAYRALDMASGAPASYGRRMF